MVYSAFKDLFSIDLNTNMFKSPLGNPIHPYELLSLNKTTVIGRYKSMFINSYIVSLQLGERGIYEKSKENFYHLFYRIFFMWL